MRQYLSKVLYILSGKHRQLIMLLCIFAFVSILEAFGIGLIGPFLSIVRDPSIVKVNPLLGGLTQVTGLETDNQIIVASATLVIGVFCIKSLAYFFCKYYIFRFSYRQKQTLETRLINTYLHISYLFHLNRNSATLIKNFAFESTQFTTNCLIPLLTIVANGIVLILLLGLLALTDLSLVVMALAIMLPIFLMFARLSRRIRGWGHSKSEAQSHMIRAVNHGLGGIKETKVLGCEDYFEADLRHHSQQYGNAAALMESFNLIPRVSIEAVLVIFLLLFVVFSQLVLGRNPEDLTAVMGVFAIASIRMIPAASQILNAVGRMRGMSYALNMLYSDLKATEAYDIYKKAGTPQLSGHSPQLKARFEQAVTLQDVTFAYPNGHKPAIQDISLTIRKGESIALVGKSGSGKTTLVDIILGLLEPASGDIRADGTSVYQNLRAWQNLLGYIPQSIFLTDETLAQNIAFGVPANQVDPERLEMSLKAAQLEDLVKQLPNGLETPVGERGVRLSGGQRQRIGIARTIYHGREILVLDEATSALDTETEKLVSDAINSLAGEKTLIIIAHRLSTIEHCDRVYQLENGLIKQAGTYEEVILAASR